MQFDLDNYDIESIVVAVKDWFNSEDNIDHLKIMPDEVLASIAYQYEKGNKKILVPNNG